MAYISRRNVLRGSAALGFMSGTGLLSAMGTSIAHAADTSGYKALVCVFFKGGLDGADTVLPYDAESHAALQEGRSSLFGAYGVGSGDSSRDRENMLELASARDFGGRRFALPRELSDLHRLYTEGRMAVVGNVGPLVEPTTRTQMVNNTVELPERLFSHNDQQSVWMSMGVEGRRIGWGGQFADIVAPVSGTARTFASITAARPEVFLNANRTRQYPARNGGPVRLSYVEDRYRLGNGADEARRLLMEHYGSSGADSNNALMSDFINANQRTLSDNNLFRDAIAMATEFTTVFPNTGIGRQLENIAKTISVRGQLGANRQLFYAEANGFDTHGNQANNLPARHGEFGAAIAAFADAMEEIGLGQDVTLFTGSDFGRTVVVNGDGTDHGWGGHHFVVGGAVQGGEIYGNIPDFDFGSESYTRSRGRLIPDVSVDQYAGALGRWFGLTNGELRSSLPNLGNFGSMPDLFGLGATV